MNKKGFTLIEVLAVIIILGLLMVIIVPKIADSIKNSKEKSYNITVESVKTAAEAYINENFDTIKSQFSSPGYITITVAELIDEGLLPTSIKNNKTGEPLGGSVTVTRISDNKYEYDYIS